MENDEIQGENVREGGRRRGKNRHHCKKDKNRRASSEDRNKAPVLDVVMTASGAGASCCMHHVSCIVHHVSCMTRRASVSDSGASPAHQAQRVAVSVARLRLGLRSANGISASETGRPIITGCSPKG